MELVKRRDVIKLAAAGVLAAKVHETAAAAAPPASSTRPPETRPGKSGGVPTRKFGKTGVDVSLLCLGGAHLGTVKDEATAVRIVHEALEAGLTFMDNAWEYNKHKSEEWMGKALAGRREKAFLMTKVCTHGRDKKVAMLQLEESLKRLGTDHVDLWQVHEVVFENDPDLHYKAGGVLEALTEAKAQGKVRFVGFTGHKHPALHLKMLAGGFAFDSVQMPINVFDAHYRSFQRDVLPVVTQKGMAALGMKSLVGTGDPVKQKLLTAEEGIRYALSLPITSLVTGVDSLEILRQNLKISREFKAMTPEEMETLRQRVKHVSVDGRLELFKSSMKYDGDEGRAQHGFPSAEDLGG